MRKIFYLVPTVILLTVLASNSPRGIASESAWPQALTSDLASDACHADLLQHPDVSQIREQIAQAETVDEARALALAPTDAAISALDKATAIMPFSANLQLAHERLSQARARIENAGTPDRVADEFNGMMLAGLDDDSPASVRIGKIGCSYSTGKIIAVIVGLILGIIPGIILLIVLC